MINAYRNRIIENLSKILAELKTKRVTPRSDTLTYEESMQQLDEYINHANEFGIAYEVIISILETEHVEVTGASAVALVEIALLLGYKTERDEDKIYDFRPRLVESV